MFITCQAIARLTRAGIADISIYTYLSTVISIFNTLIDIIYCSSVHDMSITGKRFNVYPIHCQVHIYIEPSSQGIKYLS